MYEYKATVTRVIDGDTVDVTIELGFGVQLKERLRLYGINAPELRRKASRVAGRAATDFLCEQLALVNNQILVRTIKDRKGKYGRYLGILINDSDPDAHIDLNQLMVDSGHAVEYMKG